jgi:hypothetical protein
MDSIQLIHSYTRKQALEDGILIDVTDIGLFAGFKVPVAITALVHGITSIHEIPGDGRPLRWFLHKLLLIAQLHASYERNRNSREFNYDVPFMDENQERQIEHFKCVLGPDDDGFPCVTVMMTWED